MCAALNSCNLGYDIGVNSGVGPHLQAKGEGMNLSDLQIGVVFGIFGLAGDAWRGSSLHGVGRSWEEEGLRVYFCNLHYWSFVDRDSYILSVT